MVNYKNLDEISSIIGFDPVTDLNLGITIDPDLAVSESSEIVFSDLHSLVTYKNIRDAIPYENDQITTALFNARLKAIVSKSVRSVIQSTIVKKISEESIKNVLSSFRIHSSLGSKHDLVAKKGRFVGYRISISPRMGIAAKINKIGVQMSENQTVQLKLLHGENLQVISEFEAEYSKAGSMQWFSVNELISSNNEYDYDFFYLGYYEDEIIGNAIFRSIGLSRSTCGCSGSQDYERFDNEYINVDPFEIPKQYNNGVPFFKADSVGLSSKNFGLNLDVSVLCTIDKFIKENVSMFVPYLEQQLRVEFLSLLAFSTERNGSIQDVSKRAMLALRGEMSNGEEKKLEKAIKAFDFDLSYIESPCFGRSEGGINISFF